MKVSASLTFGTALMATALSAKTFQAIDYGIAPGKPFVAADVVRLLADIKASEADMREPNRLIFAPGKYDIGPEQCQVRTWFISNHDQDNPKRVFLPLEGQQNLVVEAEGAFLNLRGRIIPVGIWDSDGVQVSDLTVDYETPPLTQVTFTAVDAAAKTVTFRPIAGTQTEFEGTRLFFKGPGFRHSAGGGILFEADGTIAYRTSDCGFNLGNVTANADGTYTAANCANGAFKPGQHMALRGWGRPAPGIVISDSETITLKDVTLYYADGMGVLAQSSEDIVLQEVRVVPNRAKGRFFSTQADATHFSGCKGTIDSRNGEYVGMMDDAINVHGTYLRVQKRVDDRTLECAYMHGQSYGFTWGGKGDDVTFIRSRQMERIAGSDNVLESIVPLDKPEVRQGAKRFRLTFAKPLPADIDPAKGALGIENLTWAPEVIFLGNRVADNRARGALFSTPRTVRCESNVFDHVSGCAVLLCGDCNGWYETGACTDVLIRNNAFINCLTSPFQFTEAVVSVCPEIPELDKQQRPLHSNIRIEDNVFVGFDRPLVFAKSVDGLTVRNNTFVKSSDYAPYHWNKEWLTLRNCKNVNAEKPRGLD